jgi:hypothetical protein
MVRVWTWSGDRDLLRRVSTCISICVCVYAMCVCPRCGVRHSWSVMPSRPAPASITHSLSKDSRRNATLFSLVVKRRTPRHIIEHTLTLQLLEKMKSNMGINLRRRGLAFPSVNACVHTCIYTRICASSVVVTTSQDRHSPAPPSFLSSPPGICFSTCKTCPHPGVLPLQPL